MNYQDYRPEGNTAPDFVLVSTSASFGADNTASVVLQCWDYGGFATVTAQHLGGSTSMRLPLDTDHNWLPDAGWRAAGQPVSDDHSQFTDTDSGPAANLNLGDGFLGFEEYRGFVAQTTHVRLNPATKDLFVISTLVEGLGFADHLPINVIRANGNEAEQADLYINYRWQNFTIAESGIYGEYAANHYSQKAPMVNNGIYDNNYPYFGGTFTPQGIYEPYPPSAVVAPSLIYVERIQEFSPSNNNRTIPNDPYDYEVIQGTIAHEIGHQVGLDHFNGACPLSANMWSVMVDHYFPQTTSLTDCAWTQIPHDYLPSELSSIILR